MLTREKLDELSSLVGAHIATDSEWAQLALECANQSGRSVREQAVLRKLLDLPCPDCSYCEREIPYLRGDGTLWHTGGVLCQDPEGQP